LDVTSAPFSQQTLLEIFLFTKKIFNNLHTGIEDRNVWRSCASCR